MNDMDTIEYATFRYDTVKVESGLKISIAHSCDNGCDVRSMPVGNI